MAKYDLNDPYDIDRLKFDFDNYSSEDWEEYIEYAKEKRLGYDKVGVLIAANRDGRSRRHTNKQKMFALSLVEMLDALKDDEVKNEKANELFEDASFELPPSNVTLRVAWHDNKWNGSICKDPENNTYCNGFHSLLSDRIRKRKEDNIQNEIDNANKSLNEIDYLPPCFWSINLFGKDPVKVSHDNPAASKLENIEEELKERSIYSWPFAVSFTRTPKEVTESGAYPKNLEFVRVPRFSAKMHEGKSIAFMYANFSNPLTEEEQQYLVVGAGIVTQKQKAQDIKHFGPEEVIQEIKNRPQSNRKYRNFPSMNWAMQFSFDDYSTVRMPYHEYLDEAENLDDNDKDEFLNKIKVAVSEPELEWCFKYVAMDIGDDEAIYILTKMRKSLIECKHDGIVPVEDMEERIYKVEALLQMAWNNRSYFPGFTSISRIILNKEDEPYFQLDEFYEDFKDSETPDDEQLLAILNNPSGFEEYKRYRSIIEEIQDRLKQKNMSMTQFLNLAMLNLKPFQFKRILEGKLQLPEWVRDFEEDVKRSHDPTSILQNPYLLYENYEYYADSHDDVYGEEKDAPIDLFKIDIAYFPHTTFLSRMGLQRQMEFNDKRRIRALVLRHLNTLENSGHCFSSAELLQEAITSYPLYYEIGKEYILPNNFFYPLNAEFANHFQEQPQRITLIEANETLYYYKTEVYNAEKELEAKFKSLLYSEENSEEFRGLKEYLDKSIHKLKKEIGEDFNEEEFVAERVLLYDNIFSKNLFVLSGSAGSGKSYEILNIIEYLEKEKNQGYLLLAPTGKAALRLSSDKDFKNIKCSTIDKYLADVKHNKISVAKRKSYQNIIIDETSMIDLIKFNKLLNTFNFNEPSFKRLILIGDPNQLPAIGYGRVLADIINYIQVTPALHSNYIRLETNCRATLQGNKVLQLAECFKTKGELDYNLFEIFYDKKETISQGFRAKYWCNKEELYGQLESEFERLTNDNPDKSLSHKLNRMFGLSNEGEIDGELDLENFQILTPYYAQYSGASKINYLIQSVFKKDEKYSLRKNIFKRADKLIRTKNYYKGKELFLSNGTLGIINEEKSETFYFEDLDGVSEIDFKDIRSIDREFFDLAYAITVHKSQGSGFNHLFLVVPERYGLLSKELIYTALTRTKKSITLFIQNAKENKKNVLEIAANRSFSASRRTSLMLDKPFRFYDLEPEKGVFVSSRIELLIYHMLMKKREELGRDKFDFGYEEKPIINNEQVNIRTDFIIYTNNKVWYWEHLGLITQKKYAWTWKNVKTNAYKENGIWKQVITTDETNGINPSKIEEIIDVIVRDEVATEDKYNQFSNHHYYLR